MFRERERPVHGISLRAARASPVPECGRLMTCCRMSSQADSLVQTSYSSCPYGARFAVGAGGVAADWLDRAAAS